ncbi:MAG: hypothetical protein AAFV45_14525 [Pseudomonadota bacterium]
MTDADTTQTPSATSKDDAQEDDKKRRGGVLLTAHRANTWWERIGWLRWLFGNGGEGALMVGSAAVVAGVTTLTTVQAVDSYYKAREIKPARIVAQSSSANTRAFVIGGRDSWGRRALFDVLVSVKSLGWVRGSTDTLEQDGRRIVSDMVQVFVLDEDVQKRLKRSNAIIAVGLASQEGDRTVETERAGKRAATTAEWITAAIQGARPVYSLNLGQYQEPCADCESQGTSWQRPLIVIGVRQSDDEVDLREALMDAFTRAKNLPSPESYSNFALNRL